MMHSPRRTHFHSLIRTAVLIVTVSALGACEREQQTPETAVPAEADDHMGEMEGMPGMQSMPGMQTQMSTQMTAHMQAMQAVGADSLRSMLPVHRQMVANMISQMNREMRDMNMAGNAQWNATVDSLRTDLVNMPAMNNQELQALMPAHHNRVTKLLHMHDEMMQSMRRNEP